jgi:DNA sulfur modification protein DndB
MNTSFEYVFPAIRGIQAGREYYTSMCPLKLIPKLFTFDDEELVPELRAQRILNRSRIPDMTQYLLSNKEDYVFSAITASIDGKIQFDPYGDEGEISRIGTLKIDMNSQFIINDGQHRRAAIQEALKKDPRLGDETIAVVFFIDKGLARCQQMFADLNRYAIRPSKSLGLLYDHRDESTQLTKRIALESSTFSDLVEMEKTALSPRSRKLFTLSAIHSANAALLHNKELADNKEALGLCINFWNQVGKHIKEWKLVRESKITSGEVRQDFVHCHAILLQAIGVMGNKLLEYNKTEQKKKLKLLEKINWNRSNSRVWEGRAMLGGRMQKASNNTTLTANYIKHMLNIELSPEEQRTEDALLRGDHV